MNKTAKKTTGKTSKPTLKVSKKDVADIERGNYCIHALALFTNAVIKERTKTSVRLGIPLTLKIGKRCQSISPWIELFPKYFHVRNQDSLTLAELGAQAFVYFWEMCDGALRDGCFTGHPFTNRKRYEVITDYGDKCIVKGGKFTFVPAKAPKAKKK